MIYLFVQQIREAWREIQTVELPHLYACAGTVLVTVTLVLSAGCGGNGDQGPTNIDRLAKQYGLDNSEYRAIQKANKDPKKLKKALEERQVEKWKELGVSVDNSAISRKTTKRPR